MYFSGSPEWMCEFTLLLRKSIGLASALTGRESSCYLPASKPLEMPIFDSLASKQVYSLNTWLWD